MAVGVAWTHAHIEESCDVSSAGKGKGTIGQTLVQDLKLDGSQNVPVFLIEIDCESVDPWCFLLPLL